MRIFRVLFFKELRELISLQIIIPILATLLIFIFIGNVLGKEQKKSTDTPVKITIQDKDATPYSGSVQDKLKKLHFELVQSSPSLSQSELIAFSQNNHTRVILVIPKGFESSLRGLSPQPFKLISIITSFSILGNRDYAATQAALQLISRNISEELLTTVGSVPNSKPYLDPLPITTITSINNRSSEISQDLVQAFTNSQLTLIPIILFFVITFSAQMVATAIATEKENKTLETLLTLPISRRSIIFAKILASAVIGLVASLIYMVGFRYYLHSLTGESLVQSNPTISNGLQQLGLTFSAGDYILLSISLFLSILCALCIALVLGVFAEDVKSLQGIISPLIVAITLPYILTLFIDINQTALPVKLLIFAIPFSHSFLTASNIFLGNYPPIYWGILYQAILILLFLWVSVRIFETERIFTLRLARRKKSN